MKYAEALTHNFDVIAERRSVLFHLCELAKASVLAEFLLEQEVEMDDSRFNFVEGSDEACCLEMPQLYGNAANVQHGDAWRRERAGSLRSVRLPGGSTRVERYMLSARSRGAMLMHLHELTRSL